MLTFMKLHLSQYTSWNWKSKSREKRKRNAMIWQNESFITSICERKLFQVLSRCIMLKHEFTAFPGAKAKTADMLILSLRLS